MKRFIISLLLLSSTTLLTAQVGIGTETPSNAAILDVESEISPGSYRGFLPPRVDSNTERDLIPAGLDDFGLMVFVSSTGCLNIWDGRTWNETNCITVQKHPWINEIHYENVGTDINEGFEVAGVAGTDLSDYRLEIYNGSNGNRTRNVALSGVIDDEMTSGYGALNFPSAPIQNQLEGVALIHLPTNSVIQFLSWEGVMTASTTATGFSLGTAAGQTSVDIGVQEGNSTLATESLQLTGTGNDYIEFTWQSPAASSMGSLNVGQTIN